MTGPDLTTAGERIEQLLDDLRSHAPPDAWADIEEVLRLLTGLYGAALARVVDLGGPDLVARLLSDDLVSSLLLVHDLHPLDVSTRVEEAVAGIRSSIVAQGGELSLEAVDADTGVVRVRLRRGKGCPSTAATLKASVERSILDAAPEIASIAIDEDLGTPVALGRKPVRA